MRPLSQDLKKKRKDLHLVVRFKNQASEKWVFLKKVRVTNTIWRNIDSEAGMNAKTWKKICPERPPFNVKRFYENSVKIWAVVPSFSRKVFVPRNRRSDEDCVWMISRNFCPERPPSLWRFGPREGPAFSRKKKKKKKKCPENWEYFKSSFGESPKAREPPKCYDPTRIDFTKNCEDLGRWASVFTNYLPICWDR